MANPLDDTFTSLIKYFRIQFPLLEDRIKTGFIDERFEVEQSDRVYPYGRLTLYDALIARDEQSGCTKYNIPNVPDESIIIKNAPNPVRLFFQFDTWSEKRRDDWSIGSQLLSLFATRHPKIITDDARELFLIPVDMPLLDVLLPENAWRKIYRFSTVLWFDDPADGQLTYLVKTFILNANNKQATIFQ